MSLDVSPAALGAEIGRRAETIQRYFALARAEGFADGAREQARLHAIQVGRLLAELDAIRARRARGRARYHALKRAESAP